MSDRARRFAASCALAAVAAQAASARQAAPRSSTEQRPSQLSVIETVKRYLPRVGATIDAARSTNNLVVSNYNHPRGGKIIIVIQNKPDKNLIGFYVYSFGNLKAARDRQEVFKYLLSANDQITIGSFFVDSEDDIGYKYLLSTEQPLTLAVFQAVYVTMAAVARERRAEISKLLENSGGK